MNTSHLTTLQGFAVNVQRAHWQARDYASHVALGDLYESLAAPLDRLAENSFVKYGSTAFAIGERIVCETNVAPVPLLDAGLAELAVIRRELSTGADDDALNIVAEMSEAINRAKYLLNLGVLKR